MPKRFNKPALLVGMLIKLDVRETRLRSMMLPLLPQGDTVTLVNEQLPLGDALICDDDGKVRLLIERKTLADLASSVVDGRYKEQGARLEQCGLPRHHVFYLIEGDVGRFRGKMKRMSGDTLRSCTISMAVIKGFSVHTVSCLGESARWVVQLAKKLGTSGGSPLYHENGDTPMCPTTAPVCTSAKKDGCTPENAALRMLAQVPGVSVATASAISAAYPTIRALVEALSANTCCLENIRIVAASGKSRRLATSVQQRVREHLGVK